MLKNLSIVFKHLLIASSEIPTSKKHDQSLKKCGLIPPCLNKFTKTHKNVGLLAVDSQQFFKLYSHFPDRSVLRNRDPELGFRKAQHQHVNDTNKSVSARHENE